MMAKGLSDRWFPICSRCRQKRVNMGNSFMEYKPLPPLQPQDPTTADKP